MPLTSLSMVASALRTDESAMSTTYHHHAAWQGQLTKPVGNRGWPERRRRRTLVTRASQTEIVWTSEIQEKYIVHSSSVSPASTGIAETRASPKEEDIVYDIISDSEEVIDCDTEDDGIEMEDVNLTEGERKARVKQNMTPDEEGFCECNPEDVDLCPVEIRERRFRLKRGITADSGAGDPVIPKRMVNSKLITPSVGSKRGLHYVSATNHRIPNVGEVNMEFITVEEGHAGNQVFQVADVNKALMSLSDRVDNRNRIVFDQDDETGEDLTHIYDKRLKKKMKLKRVGKVWVLDVTVPESFLASSNSGFRRPGP